MIGHEVNKAFEMLNDEKVEAKKYAAIVILREMAFSMPTFFFQNVQQFFKVFHK